MKTLHTLEFVSGARSYIFNPTNLAQGGAFLDADYNEVLLIYRYLLCFLLPNRCSSSLKAEGTQIN